jgi:ribonuclease-3
MADPAHPLRTAEAARLQAVHDVLGHCFNDEHLLLRACTHASRCGAQATAQKKREQANERIEFLGDALLGAALCHQLYRRFPEADEGELSRWKAKLASREVLAAAIDQTGLLPHCLVGAQLGEGGPESWPVSVKANLAEGLLGGTFLDGGWEALATAVERLLGHLLDDPTHGTTDPRMRLQELCHKQQLALPLYTCERSGGTDHAPLFQATVRAGELHGSGTGNGRRRAEAEAARMLLSRWPYAE